MRKRIMTAGYVGTGTGMALLALGLTFGGSTAYAGPGTTELAPAKTHRPIASNPPGPRGCPPSTSHDPSDHGFFTVGPAVGGSSGGLVKVHQPFTLKLYCYDPEVEHATVKFTAKTSAGNSVSVPALHGSQSLVFTGQRDLSKLDASETYTLDLSVLGAAPPDGWHVTANITIAGDESSNRTVPFVIVTPKASPSPSPSVSPTKQVVTPTPTPSVAAVHVTKSPAQLPFTGPPKVSLMTTIGVGMLIIGGCLLMLGRRRRARVLTPPQDS